MRDVGSLIRSLVHLLTGIYLGAVLRLETSAPEVVWRRRSGGGCPNVMRRQCGTLKLCQR